MKTIMYWIGIPLLIVVCLLAVFSVMTFRNGDWSWIDTYLLSLIIGAYATEMIFYFGIAKQYQFFGDHEIFAGIYSIMNENVNKDPITSEGKKVMSYIDYILENASNINEAMILFNDVKRKIPNLSREDFETYAKVYYNAISNVDIRQILKDRK